MIGWIRDWGPLGRRAALLLVVCALLVRVAIPAGWMPDASAHGFGLTICTGTVDAPQDVQISGVLKAALEKQQPAPDAAHKTPCDFTAVAHGADVPAPTAAVAVPAAPLPAQRYENRLSSAPGRGLAAPPPPPTGPPANLA